MRNRENGDAGVVFGWLDFAGAASGILRYEVILALSSREWIFCEESPIRIASAAVFELENAVDSRLGGFADFVEEIGQGVVVGSFVDGLPAGANLAKASEVVLERRH